ncbi:MAG TPA: lipoyl(octanoyl) transferase LipB [Burkholderiaceae bacterium]|nr:lipoyl(octanoyl) transferase LipB [Burkholderiaceae bacterium]
MASDFVIQRLGRADYAPTVQAMQRFTAERDANTPDELWLVEHPPVFTLGQAARHEHVLAPGDIPVEPTDRGGQVTYHGPGQVIAYPLIDLRRRGLYVKEAVRRIEQAVIDLLAAHGIAASRVQGAPGVYVRRDGEVANDTLALADARKIAALGLKVRNGCTYHGVALNVAMDLEPFRRIDPCGYPGLEATDMASCRVLATPSAIADELASHLIAQLTLSTP